MNKILNVIRVSTDRQETESQKQEMIGFSKGLGFEENQIEWIEVSGASARKLNRKYLDMLETIKSKLILEGIDKIAFWHLNRLGRIESKLQEMKEWFVKNKIQVYVKNPSLTLLNDKGELDAGSNIAWSVFAATISYETEEIMLKTKRGKEQKKKLNKYTGGILPYGYRLDSDNYIVIDWEYEGKIVKEIFEMYSTGKYSDYTLSIELKKRGYKKKNGNLITSPAITNILSNQIYIGKEGLTGRIYGKIIDESLFNACSEIRKKNLLDISKETKNNYLGVKLIKCECGSNYICNSRDYSCFKYKYRYREPKYRELEHSPSIKREVLDYLIKSEVLKKEYLFLSSSKERNLEESKKNIQIIKLKISEAESRLTSIISKKERLKELYIEGEISKEKFKTMSEKINSDENSLKKELVQYKEEIDKEIHTIELLNKFDLIDMISGVYKKVQDYSDTDIYEASKRLIKSIQIKEIDNYKVIFFYFTYFKRRSVYIFKLHRKIEEQYLYYYNEEKEQLSEQKISLELKDYSSIWFNDEFRAKFKDILKGES